MVRFEEVLAEHLSRPLRMPELCALVAVSNQTLRLCCAEFLGMSPTQYLLLRRLKEVRRELRNADPNMVTVAEVARRFGFAEGGASPRHTGRHSARRHLPLSNVFQECDWPLRKFSQFLHSRRKIYCLALARSQRQMWSEANLATLLYRLELAIGRLDVHDAFLKIYGFDGARKGDGLRG